MTKEEYNELSSIIKKCISKKRLEEFIKNFNLVSILNLEGIFESKNIVELAYLKKFQNVNINKINNSSQNILPQIIDSKSLINSREGLTLYILLQRAMNAKNESVAKIRKELFDSAFDFYFKDYNTFFKKLEKLLKSKIHV